MVKLDIPLAVLEEEICYLPHQSEMSVEWRIVSPVFIPHLEVGNLEMQEDNDLLVWLLERDCLN